MGGNNENDRVASPENEPIDLKVKSTSRESNPLLHQMTPIEKGGKMIMLELFPMKVKTWNKSANVGLRLLRF